MKKITITAAAAAIISALATATAGHAQTAADAYSYSSIDYYGTARSIAMGNAFTALGGDIGGISINPAGSGVYRYSELEFSFGGSFAKTRAGIYGDGISIQAGRANDFRDGQNKFTMPNF